MSVANWESNPGGFESFRFPDPESIPGFAITRHAEYHTLGLTVPRT
jgi:hypothetical protein